MPEGYTLDGERLTDTTALFKELNLSQDQAQKLIDRYVKADGENAQGLRALMDVERQQRVEKWGADLKEQLGNNYEATVADARAAVTWANDPALVEAFDAEGWGNHPALVAFFSKVGAAVRGDKLNGLGGETANRPEKTMAERIYPNMK